MGQDKLREFDIDPLWLLLGPGDTPRAHGEAIDRERFGRLVDEAERINGELGLAPSAPGGGIRWETAFAFTTAGVMGVGAALYARVRDFWR